MLDDTDRRILRQLQADPTLSGAGLADRTGLNAATCWRRLERLRERGVLRGVRGVIDWRALGYSVEVSLRVTLDKTVPRAFDDSGAVTALAALVEATPNAASAGARGAGPCRQSSESLQKATPWRRTGGAIAQPSRACRGRRPARSARPAGSAFPARPRPDA